MPDPATQPSSPESVRLIVFDVDGVLTDGKIVYDTQGFEAKAFHIRDGFALKDAPKATGLQVAVLTARKSYMVSRRMKELKIKLFVQGSKDKGADIDRLCERAGVTLEQTGYLGDDLYDLPAMRKVGYPMAVADAAPELREMAAYVTSVPGGHGAARDAIEHVLRAQGQWGRVVEKFQ